MALNQLPKINFGGGELDPEMEGRLDLEVRFRMLGRARNVVLRKGGAVSVRPGWKFLEQIVSPVIITEWRHRTGTFIFGVGQEVAFLFDLDGNLVDSVAHFSGSGLTEEDLRTYRMDSTPDFMALSHTSGNAWLFTYNLEDSGGARNLTVFNIAGATHDLEGDNAFYRQVPMDAQVDPPVNVTVPGSPAVKAIVTAPAPIFEAGFAAPGRRFYANGASMLIDTVSPDGLTIQGFTSAAGLGPMGETTDWGFRAIDGAAGGPNDIAFHQNRLVLGATAQHPRSLAFSKVGEFDVFNVRTGLDNDGIDLDIVASDVGNIQAIISASNGALLALTDRSIVEIGGSPLTSSSITTTVQTSIGAAPFKPVRHDVMTYFVRGAGYQDDEARVSIGALRFNDVIQTFEVIDVGVLSEHLLTSPIQLAFQDQARADGSNRLFILDDSGNITAFHTPTPGSFGATRFEMDATTESIAMVDGRLYAVMEKAGTRMLARMF